MIDAQQAVLLAKQKAAEMLSTAFVSLEEIERDSYRDREVWSITLGFPRDFSRLSPVAKLSADALCYKRFWIDAETGELLAMKLREVASR